MSWSFHVFQLHRNTAFSQSKPTFSKCYIILSRYLEKIARWIKVLTSVLPCMNGQQLTKNMYIIDTAYAAKRSFQYMEVEDTFMPYMEISFHLPLDDGNFRQSYPLVFWDYHRVNDVINLLTWARWQIGSSKHGCYYKDYSVFQSTVDFVLYTSKLWY